MQITNCGRGVHVREVKGVGRLKTLPKDWYAFTNLELAAGIGRSRELDVIVVTDHMIFLVDLKDWSGKIESDAGALAPQRTRHGIIAGRQDPRQCQGRSAPSVGSA